MSKALFHGESCTVPSDSGVVREYFPVGDVWVSDEIFPFVADTVQTRVFDVSNGETSSAADSRESTTTAGAKTVTVQLSTFREAKRRLQRIQVNPQPKTYTRRVTY